MIYLVDASVYVFRAYYSMPPDMADSDGNPTHALFGFARFLGDLIERAKPEYLAVAFDESLTSSFRNQFYPAYKANRDPAQWAAGDSAGPSAGLGGRGWPAGDLCVLRTA